MANMGELTDGLQNKSLSDDLNPLMELQGVPWLARKAASMATIKARLTQHTGPDGVASLTTEGMSAGGLKAKATTYRLDGCEVKHEGQYGVTRMRARLVDGPASQPLLSLAAPEALDAYLTEGWLYEDGKQTQLPRHIQIHIDNSTAGSAEQVWGFSTIAGQRRRKQHPVFVVDPICINPSCGAPATLCFWRSGLRWLWNLLRRHPV